MKTIDLSEVSALGPLLRSNNVEPLIVLQNGTTVAAIVPATDEDVESLLLSVNPKFQDILKRSQERLEAEGGLTTAEVRNRLGLPPADAKE